MNIEKMKYETYKGRGPRRIAHWEHFSNPDAATYIAGIDYYDAPKSCMERMNELELYFKDDPTNHRGWRTINVTDAEHPYAGAWWPPGHILGWEESHIHQVADFLKAIIDDTPCDPDFSVGVQNQAVLEALAESAASGQWVKVPA